MSKTTARVLVAAAVLAGASVVLSLVAIITLVVAAVLGARPPAPLPALLRPPAAALLTPAVLPPRPAGTALGNRLGGGVLR